MRNGHGGLVLAELVLNIDAPFIHLPGKVLRKLSNSASSTPLAPSSSERHSPLSPWARIAGRSWRHPKFPHSDTPPPHAAGARRQCCGCCPSTASGTECTCRRPQIVAGGLWLRMGSVWMKNMVVWFLGLWNPKP